jgi:ribosomal protein S18 acetylase RimI-like enzyme
MPREKKLQFRALTVDDVQAFREIRLESLQKHPEAFLGSYDVESEKPLEYFIESLSRDVVIGCFKDEKLLGIAGYYVITPDGKRSHSAKIWGFYIRPEYRGRGFAKKLFNVVLGEAEKVAEKALLKVNHRNKSAIRLYKALGFVEYGLERKSLKIGDKYYDDRLMVKFF